MHRHRIKALPVLDRARRVVGILTLADSRRFRRSGRTHGDRAEVLGPIMSSPAQTALETTPV